MATSRKVIIGYIIAMIIATFVFLAIARYGHDPLLVMQYADYVITFAKIVTLASILYFLFDIIIGERTNKKIYINIITLIILGIILYLLFI